MCLPKELIPILEKITKEKGIGLEFWSELDGDELDDMLFNLSSELMLSEVDENSIPIGYKLVAYIYHWESSCLFSGWYALENYGDMLPAIIECYDRVGLSQEALALKRASQAWDSVAQDHEKVGAAYSSVENPYKDEDSRLEYLGNYFKENSNVLFYRKK